MLMGEFTKRAARSVMRSSTGSPPESAAKGGCTDAEVDAEAMACARVAAGRGGGGEACKNNISFEPGKVTARWSAGTPAK